VQRCWLESEVALRALRALAEVEEPAARRAVREPSELWAAAVAPVAERCSAR
jgi:hypothetical protein